MLRRINSQFTGEFDISGVMTVHNEENFLPFSLYFLQKAAINELIVVLDNCTDGSEEMINWFKRNSTIKVYIIKVTKHNWKNPTAELAQLAFSKANGNIIYYLPADNIYDPRIFLINWTGLDMVGFFHNGYDIFGELNEKLRANWLNFYSIMLRYVYPKLRRKPLLVGNIFAFKKILLDDVQIFDEPSWDTSFLRIAFKKGYRYKLFTGFRNYHLRPVSHLMKSGREQFNLGYPLWKILGESILYFTSQILKGYLQESKRKRMNLYVQT
jgi:hypothetical protein